MAKKYNLKKITDYREFNNAPKGKPPKSPHNPLQRKVFDFTVGCPLCGRHNIIKIGIRRNKRKPPVQMYKCKRDRHKFTPIPGGQFSQEIVEKIFDFTLKRMRPSDIVDQIKKDFKVEISRQTVRNTIRRYIDIILKFERGLKITYTPTEWIIDDTPQIFPAKKEEIRQVKEWICTKIKRLQGKRNKRMFHYKGRRGYVFFKGDKYFVAYGDFAWITSVIDVSSRYLLSSQVTSTRQTIDSERAIIKALGITDPPAKIKCDGFMGHISAAKNTLPNTDIDSKTKEEVYWHINLIEYVHSVMRKTIIPKRGLRSVENVQCKADLFRMHWNFLRRFNESEGLTPAAKGGVAPLFKGWADLIDYAYKHQMQRSA